MTPKTRLTQLHHQFQNHQRRIIAIRHEMESLAKTIFDAGYRHYNPNDTFKEFAAGDPEFIDHLFTSEPKWTNVMAPFIESGYEEEDE